MAETESITSPLTVTRIGVLKMQIRIALRRAANMGDRELNDVCAAVEKKWVNRIAVYGLDSGNLCHAQLDLVIDWDRYGFEITSGHAIITIGRGWINNTAIELDEALDLFNRYVVANSLTTKVSYFHPSWVSLDMLRREFGWILQEELHWASGGIVDWSIRIPEVPELRIGCKLLE